MECLICKRSAEKLSNINLRYDDSENTVKDDIIEILGDSIVDHLDDTQEACTICIRMLDDVVRSKFKLLEAIISQNGQKPNLGRYWNFIARGYHNNYTDGTYRDLTPSMTTNTPPLPSSGNTTPLLYVTKTKDFHEELEKNVEIWQGMKSDLNRYNSSAASSRCASRGSSAADKRRIRNEEREARSKSAMVQKLRRDVVRSAQSDTLGRPMSVASQASYLSFTEDDRRKSPGLFFDAENSVHPVKRRKSIISAHRKNQKKKKGDVEFECQSLRCRNVYFGNSLEFFTAHLIEVHSCKTPYKCQDCGNEFVTSKHLRLHMKNHDTGHMFCGLCGAKKRNTNTYQKHIDHHLTSSFKCSFCDKDFVSKKECNFHLFKNHPRRKLSSINRIENKILDVKLYKKPSTSTNNDETITESNESTTTGQFSCIVMNNVASATQPLGFRGRSFPELDYIQRKRRDEPGRYSPIFDEEQITSLGDDIIYNEEIATVAECLSARRTPDTPSSFNRDDSSFQGSISPSPSRRKKRRPTWESGRSTPFERFDGHFEDDLPVEPDMPNFDHANWELHRRELESRNTEVEELFGGETEEDDESYRYATGKRSTATSITTYVSEADTASDVDTEETQYIDGDKFVSINNYDRDEELS